ncbi:hypothetical protein Trco_004119 [Trichoderma cornu-damae]|uniref:Secreted protein n=1 Tax=Trichoderma cornu-damae TaxID=654480 RepID=A0A9P8TTV7_9HYPO|nr:hypothetical protein Trco_004119 [Trichoderma cornu-damae]
MRPKLFQFLLEKLLLIVCNRLFVEDEDLRDVVIVYLKGSRICNILEHLVPLPLNQVEFLENLLDPRYLLHDCRPGFAKVRVEQVRFVPGWAGGVAAPSPGLGNRLGEELVDLPAGDGVPHLVEPRLVLTQLGGQLAVAPAGLLQSVAVIANVSAQGRGEACAGLLAPLVFVLGPHLFAHALLHVQLLGAPVQGGHDGLLLAAQEVEDADRVFVVGDVFAPLPEILVGQDVLVEPALQDLQRPRKPQAGGFGDGHGHNLGEQVGSGDALDILAGVELADRDRLCGRQLGDLGQGGFGGDRLVVDVIVVLGGLSQPLLHRGALPLCDVLQMRAAVGAEVGIGRHGAGEVFRQSIGLLGQAVGDLEPRQRHAVLASLVVRHRLIILRHGVEKIDFDLEFFFPGRKGVVVVAMIVSTLVIMVAARNA